MQAATDLFYKWTNFVDYFSEWAFLRLRAGQYLPTFVLVFHRILDFKTGQHFYAALFLCSLLLWSLSLSLAWLPV
jgi:hypothetical protein